MSTMPMTDSKRAGESSSVRAMKFPAALLTRMSSGAVAPDGIDHGFDGVEIADVAGEGVDWCLCAREFGGGLFENFFAAAADVDCRAEFEEAVGHAFAEAGAAAGDEDAFVVQKIGAEHGCLPRHSEEMPANSRVPHRAAARFGMTRVYKLPRMVRNYSDRRRLGSRSRRSGNRAGCWSGRSSGRL